MKDQPIARAAAITTTVFALCAIVAPPAFADSYAPRLTSFSRLSGSVLRGGDDIKVAFTASDQGGSKVLQVTFEYTGPYGRTQAAVLGNISASSVSGIAVDGLTGWAPSGQYTLDHIDVSDYAGNYTTYRRDGTTESSGIAPPAASFNLASADFAVNNPGEDYTTPVLHTAALYANPVPAGDPVVVTYTVTDDRSGVGGFDIQYTSPQGLTVWVSAPLDLAPAGPASYVVPIAGHGGLYTIAAIHVRDRADNIASYNVDGTIDGVSPSGSVAPPGPAPDLHGLEFTVTPKTNDTTAPQLTSVKRRSTAYPNPGEQIALNYQTTDTGTGVAEVWARWRTSSGYELEMRKHCGVPSGGPGTVRLPSWVDTGVKWRLVEVHVTDALGNGAAYNRDGTVSAVIGTGPSSHTLVFADSDFTVTAGDPSAPTLADTTNAYCPRSPDVTFTTSDPEVDAGDTISIGGSVERAGDPVPSPLMAVYAYCYGCAPKLHEIRRGSSTGRFSRSFTMDERRTFRSRFLGSDLLNPSTPRSSLRRTVDVGKPTALAIGSSPSSLTYPADVRVVGTLTLRGSTYALSGKPVRLYVRPAGASSYSLQQTRTTNSYGRVAFSYEPTRNTSFYLRYLGTETTYIRSLSPLRTVGVRPRISVVASDTSITLGQTVKLSGTLLPSTLGRTVYLQQRSGGVWSNFKSTTVSSSHAYTFFRSPGRRGTYYFRIYRPADSARLAGYSRVVTVTVS